MKQNKASRNRTALSAIHASVPRFPDACSLPASDIHDWIDSALSSWVLCLCQVEGTHPDCRVLSEIYFFE